MSQNLFISTPAGTFSTLLSRAARFKGFQQQDSQELLRYLLDGMRAEELKVRTVYHPELLLSVETCVDMKIIQLRTVYA